MENKMEVTDELNEESLKERFDKMVDSLVRERSWTPRKARRYLNSEARRSVKKMMKHRTKNKIDTSDITAEAVE